MWILLKHQHQQENKIVSWVVIRIFEFSKVNTIRIIRIGNRTHSSQILLTCYWEKNVTANMSFLRVSVKEKEKEKQKEQEQCSEIITGSQVEPISSESKYLSWSTCRSMAPANIVIFFSLLLEIFYFLFDQSLF